MKKILILNALFWAMNTFPASGQTVWNQLLLTGASAKIITTAKPPRFNISFTGAFPLGSIASQNIEFAAFQNAAFSPEIMGQLFEKLGGPFFIGGPSSQPTQTVELVGQTQAMPGLRVGLRLGNRFELRAGGQYFQSKWSGEFPVFVLPHFPQEQPQSKTLQGSASASTSGMLLEIDMVFFVAGGGVVRPFVKGGVRGQFALQNSSGASIEGAALPLEVSPVETAFSPFGGAGLQVSFLKNGFVEAGCSFGKLPDGDYKPSLVVGVGWGF